MTNCCIAVFSSNFLIFYSRLCALILCILFCFLVLEKEVIIIEVNLQILIFLLIIGLDLFAAAGSRSQNST